MKREGKVSININNFDKRFNYLDTYHKCLYNNFLLTNKSVKFPSYCPNGRKKCKFCSLNIKKERKKKHKNYLL